MIEGLIHSYAGQMILLSIWAFLGLVGTCVLTVVVFVRKGLPLTTQLNRQTGVKEHGVGRWWLVIGAFCLGPQLLLMFAVSGVHFVLLFAAWVGAHWWLLPIVGAVLVSAGLVWWFARSSSEVVAPQAVALPPAVAAQPVPAPAIWSMPEIEGNWADRREP